MTITRITISKKHLSAGEPAYCVGGEWWDGFSSCYGDVYVCAEDGQAWVEHHGDPEALSPGGRQFAPGVTDLDLVRWNLMVPGMRQRLQKDPSLIYAAINRERFLEGKTAVTVYQMYDGMICPALCPRVRLEGLVYSATIKPPRLGFPEPLNFWIETRDIMEIL